jgi:hypothetical protein
MRFLISLINYLKLSLLLNDYTKYLSSISRAALAVCLIFITNVDAAYFTFFKVSLMVVDLVIDEY